MRDFGGGKELALTYFCIVFVQTLPSIIKILKGMHANTLDQQYTRICRIGSGNYGQVFLFERKKGVRPNFLENLFRGEKKSSSDYVAMKLYKTPNTNNRVGIDFSCLREITCLQGLNHRNIIKCTDIIYQPRPQGANLYHEIYVVMDFHLQLTDLLNVSTTFQDKKKIAKQITQGLKYLHDNYIFHRDLKPANLFVSKSGYISIADFGFAKEFGTPYKKYTKNACTIEYRAPEIFLGTHYYTQMSDIWSLGCIFVYIFTGKSLFQSEGKSEIQLLMEIFYLAGTPDESNWSQSIKMPFKYKCNHQNQKNFAEQLKIPGDVGAFIELCMKIDPTKRLSATQLLNHSFFKDISEQPFDVKDIYQAKLRQISKKNV